jgi:hypothetical protein
MIISLFLLFSCFYWSVLFVIFYLLEFVFNFWIRLQDSLIFSYKFRLYGNHHVIYSLVSAVADPQLHTFLGKI